MVRPPQAPPLTSHQADLCYATVEKAHRLAVEQLAIYEQWAENGWIRLLRSRDGLDAHVEAWAAGDRTTGVVLLMEGADPIRTPAELSWWWDRGLRLVGPAWQRTHYAGGTSAPGPLTDLGHELVEAMIDQGVPLDVSHLAEESFWDAMALDPALVLASHSNARALVPGDRHLTDAMIRAVGERDGVVGLVLGNEMLRTPDASAPPPATLRDVRRHAEHIAGLIGWERVAIGSDFDGGFGVQETPRGLTRGADFARLGRAAPSHARNGLLGGNWLRFLRRALPEASS
jgi:membrane dipeptidase